MLDRSRFVRRSCYRPEFFETLESRLLLTAVTLSGIKAAYGFNSVTQTGAGQTIAIVDAYDAPTIVGDLAVFDAANGLPDLNLNGTAPSFQIQKMSGSVKANAGWATEISLDVEWAHAIAPGANILLVEAVSNSFADLFAAVDYARNQPGVSVVSMSWGSNEFSGETQWDSYLITPAGHQGVTFVASSGDAGGVISYPAISPNVVSVGGTTLKLTGSTSETAWSGSGGGTSKIESASAAQQSVTNSSHRSNPDVAYDADPNTGFLIYDSTRYQSLLGWMQFGGTSAGAPQWAALLALANQGRVDAHMGTLDGVNDTIPALYSHAGDFNDITSGKTSRSISAGNGYDLATGLGSPKANLLVTDLIKVIGVTAAGTQTTGGGGGNLGANSVEATSFEGAEVAAGLVATSAVEATVAGVVDKAVSATPGTTGDSQALTSVWVPAEGSATRWTLSLQPESRYVEQSADARTNLDPLALIGGIDLLA